MTEWRGKNTTDGDRAEGGSILGNHPALLTEILHWKDQNGSKSCWGGLLAGRMAGGQLIVVDYKATSKNPPPTLEGKWQQTYKRQIEVYQWLFQMNGFSVSPIAYFVYCNGDSRRDRFNATIRFEISVLSHAGNTDWIENVPFSAKACLLSEEMPLAGDSCQFCFYRKNVSRLENAGAER